MKAQQKKFEADHAILVTDKLPAEVKSGNFGFKNGAWICRFQDVPKIEKVLRHFMLKIHTLKKSQGNNKSTEKSLHLYNFIKSEKFKEATNQVLGERSPWALMLADLGHEEEYMRKKWKKRREYLSNIKSAIRDLSDTIEKRLNADNQNSNNNGNNLNVDEDDEESGVFSVCGPSTLVCGPMKF